MGANLCCMQTARCEQPFLISLETGFRLQLCTNIHYRSSLLPEIIRCLTEALREFSSRGKLCTAAEPSQEADAQKNRHLTAFEITEFHLPQVIKYHLPRVTPPCDVAADHQTRRRLRLADALFADGGAQFAN